MAEEKKSIWRADALEESDIEARREYMRNYMGKYIHSDEARKKKIYARKRELLYSRPEVYEATKLRQREKKKEQYEELKKDPEALRAFILKRKLYQDDRNDRLHFAGHLRAICNTLNRGEALL